MIKNVIFDWSGTLSDDFAQGYAATMGVFRRLGIPLMSREHYRAEFTLPYMNFYRRFTAASEETIRRLFLEEVRGSKGPALFPGVEELLRELNSRGLSLAILSSHPQERLEEEVRCCGLEELFLEVKGSVHDKTTGIAGILERRRLARHETAYVGDMTHDLEAGRQAEVLTIAVTWGYQPCELLASLAPDMLIDDIRRLKEILSPRPQGG